MDGGNGVVAGDVYKRQKVREYLADKGYEAKSKEGESMEVCFIKGDYRDFLREPVSYTHLLRLLYAVTSSSVCSRPITIMRKSLLSLYLGQRVF